MFCPPIRIMKASFMVLMIAILVPVGVNLGRRIARWEMRIWAFGVVLRRVRGILGVGSRWVGGLLLVWGLRVGPCEVCAEDCLLVHLFSSPLLPSMIWRFGRILTRRRSVSLYLFGFRSFGFPFTRPTFPSRLSIFHGVCICAIETPLRLLLSRFPSRLTITRVGPRFRRFDDSRILNPFRLHVVLAPVFQRRLFSA